MKLNLEDFNKLSSLLAACKVAGIEAVVISEGMFRGINPSKSAAIITKCDIDIEDNTLGIGRVNELIKRLDLFGGNTTIDLVANPRKEISSFTIHGKSSKAQFRCTSEKLIRHPKSNEDEPVAVINISRAEAQQISKAAYSMGATHIVVQCSRDGTLKIECREESTNDVYSQEIESKAEFIGDPQSFVLSFLTSNWALITLTAVKTVEILPIQIGEISATLKINDHSMIIMSQLTEEENDE